MTEQTPTANSVGSSVRFTASRLGLMENPEAVRFEDEVANEGDFGIYEGLHSGLGGEGWHVVRVGDLYCPCHRSQFEFLTDDELVTELSQNNPLGGYERPQDNVSRMRMGETLQRYQGKGFGS